MIQCRHLGIGALRALGLLSDGGLETLFFGKKDTKLCLPGNV